MHTTRTHTCTEFYKHIHSCTHHVSHLLTLASGVPVDQVFKWDGTTFLELSTGLSVPRVDLSAVAVGNLIIFAGGRCVSHASLHYLCLHLTSTLY